MALASTDVVTLHMQGLAYTKTEGDEVEDLMQLLAAAKTRFPDLQGVASGAIASDYQRLRVESVRWS
jgi:diphthine-ammonia ligase